MESWYCIKFSEEFNVVFETLTSISIQKLTPVICLLGVELSFYIW